MKSGIKVQQRGIDATRHTFVFISCVSITSLPASCRICSARAISTAASDLRAAASADALLNPSRVRVN